MSTRTYTAQLVVMECSHCHMNYGITQKFQETKRRDHKYFYCPAGHPSSYPQKSKEDILRRQVTLADEATARARRRADNYEAQSDHHRRSASTYKGQVTKIKNRVGNGVCPCCNRTFKDLQRHMSWKHPDYVEVKPNAP